MTVNGRGPAAGFINYSRELAAFTKGKGMFSFRFDGYEPCQNQEELAARFSYDPEADLEYTPDSVSAPMARAIRSNGIRPGSICI